MTAPLRCPSRYSWGVRTSMMTVAAVAAVLSALSPLVVAAGGGAGVVLLTGELFFCAHHAREHGERLKEVALLFQDETATLTAGD